MRKNKEASKAEKKQWFESFKTMISGMGYDNPLAMAMICVRNEPENPEILNNIRFDPSDAVRYFNEFENSSQPAFVPVNSEGKPLNPRDTDEKYADWIYNNTLNDISDDHIDFLYNMAVDNRLFVKKDSVNPDVFTQNRYFFVNDDGSCGLSPTLDELYKERRKNPEAKTVGPYPAEEYEALDKNDGVASNLESNLSSFIVMTDMHLRQDGALEDESDQKIWNYFKHRDQLNARRDITVHAHTHSSWYNNERDAKLLAEIYTICKKEENQITEEERDLVKQYPVITAGFDDIEKSLLKKTGKKTLKELSESGLIFDAEHKAISGSSELEFASALGRNLMASENSKIYIEDKPFKFVSGYGLQEVTSAEPFREEVEFLVGRLKKTEGNWTSNTPQYDAFSKALKALPAKLSDPNKAYSFEQIEGLISEVSKLGQDYIDVHRKNPLDARQTERVKVINRLSDVLRDARKRNPAPGKDLNYRLAEKLFTASAIKSGNQKLLLHEDVRERTIAAIMESKEFRDETAALSNDEKLRQLKTPGAQYLKRNEPNIFLFDGFMNLREAQFKDVFSFASAEVMAKFDRKELPNPLSIRAGRISIRSLATCKMLRTGKYTVEDIMNPDKLKAEKAEFGRQAVEEIMRGDGYEVRCDLIEGEKKLNDYAKGILNEMPDFTMRSIMDPRYRNLAQTCVIITDVFQELEHNGVKESGTAEEQKELRDVKTIASVISYAGLSIKNATEGIQKIRSGEIPASNLAMNYAGNCLQLNIFSEVFKGVKKQAGKNDVTSVLLQSDKSGELKETPVAQLMGSVLAQATIAFAGVVPEVHKLAMANDKKSVAKLLKDTVEDKFKFKFGLNAEKTRSGADMITVKCKNPEVLLDSLPKVKKSGPQLQ